VATEEADRGFARPVLVTADEVELAQDRGGALELLMREPVHDRPWDREVVYR
jgi:hypothetical protein